MAFYGGFAEDEFVEEMFIEAPCEFCNDPFPLLLLTEHQTGCRPDLVRVKELTVEEIQEQINIFENIPQDGVNSESLIQLSAAVPEPRGKNIPLIDLTEDKIPTKIPVITSKEKEHKQANKTKQDFFVETEEILEDDILQEIKTLSLSTNKEKRLEEEKPTFRVPSTHTLSSPDKSLIHNVLPESDNEDSECLEDFWKRADIKLAQKLRMMDNKV